MFLFRALTSHVRECFLAPYHGLATAGGWFGGARGTKYLGQYRRSGYPCDVHQSALGTPHCPSRKGDKEIETVASGFTSAWPCFHLFAASPGVVESAPVIPWPDQFPSIAPY